MQPAGKLAGRSKWTSARARPVGGEAASTGGVPASTLRMESLPLFETGLASSTQASAPAVAVTTVGVHVAAAWANAVVDGEDLNSQPAHNASAAISAAAPE
jgi:hypothetical protein